MSQVLFALSITLRSHFPIAVVNDASTRFIAARASGCGLVTGLNRALSSARFDLGQLCSAAGYPPMTISLEASRFHLAASLIRASSLRKNLECKMPAITVRE
jgi:hypothetical protein